MNLNYEDDERYINENGKAMVIKTIICQVHSGSWAWRRHREDGGQG